MKSSVANVWVVTRGEIHIFVVTFKKDSIMRCTHWLAIAMVGFLCSPVCAQEETPSKPVPLVTPGSDTTRITSPLDDEGYVDFCAALNEEFSANVDPDQNAAVLLIKAFGVLGENVEFTTLLRSELGLPALADGEVGLIPIDQWKQSAVADGAGAGEPAKPPYEQAMSRPWRASEFPELAQGLEQNKAPLDLLTQASRRPQYYRPIVRMKPDDPLFAVLLPDVQESRDACRQLVMRSMLHLGEGDVAKSQEDLLTLHRLAGLMSHGTSLIEGLVAIACDSMAYAADSRWATHPLTTAEQLRDYRTRLQQLPGLRPMAPALDRGERYMGCDAIQCLARGRLNSAEVTLLGKMSNEPLDEPEGKTGLASLFELVGRSVVDWNLLMKEYNQSIDEVVEAASIPTGKARLAALTKLQEDYAERSAEASDPLSLALGLLGGKRVRAKQVGAILSQLLLPAITTCGAAEIKHIERKHLTVIGLAILEYRLRNGSYPQQLSDLTPAYLNTIPLDEFTDQPLQYRVTPDGFGLWSVGPDGIDQQGASGWDGSSLRDDISFLVPIPDQQ